MAGNLMSRSIHSPAPCKLISTRLNKNSLDQTWPRETRIIDLTSAIVITYNEESS
jgi:hypothetical protein